MHFSYTIAGHTLPIDARARGFWYTLAGRAFFVRDRLKRKPKCRTRLGS